jgi:hypothetical protein
VLVVFYPNVYFYLWILLSSAYTPPMAETLEQILEKTKRVILEKQGQVHSLLRDLAELVPDGDKLAIEGYFAARVRGGKSSFSPLAELGVGIVSRGSAGSGVGSGAIYAEMTKRQAVNEVLLKAGRPMNTLEVYQELVRGGYPFSGRDPLTVFRTEIYKYADRHDRGLFIVAADYSIFRAGNGGGRKLLAQGCSGVPVFLGGTSDLAALEGGLARLGLLDDCDSVADAEFAAEVPGAEETALDVDEVLALERDVLRGFGVFDPDVVVGGSEGG